MFHRTNHCLGLRRLCICGGGSIKTGARPFWGKGVFVLVISNINIGFQKSFTLPLTTSENVIIYKY